MCVRWLLYSGVGFRSSQIGNLIITNIIKYCNLVSSTFGTGWYDLKTNMLVVSGIESYI